MGRTDEDEMDRLANARAAEKPTLRDQFAMAALPTVLAAQLGLARAGHIGDRPKSEAAEAAYEIADAMLAERSKKK